MVLAHRAGRFVLQSNGAAAQRSLTAGPVSPRGRRCFRRLDDGGAGVRDRLKEREQTAGRSPVGADGGVTARFLGDCFFSSFFFYSSELFFLSFLFRSGLLCRLC